MKIFNKRRETFDGNFTGARTLRTVAFALGFALADHDGGGDDVGDDDDEEDGADDEVIKF